MPESVRLGRMIELYSPESEIELMFLKSIFDEAALTYFVKNDTFGSLTVGPQIELYNKKTVFVLEEQLDEARELLCDLRRRTREPRPRFYPRRDKLRMLVELFLFGWIMPGRRHARRPRLRLIDPEAEPKSPAETDDPPPAPASRRRPPLRLIRGSGRQR